MKDSEGITIRKATLDDSKAILAVINQSARAIAESDYTPEQVELALQGAFGLDTQLVKDGTYFVAELDGLIVGCGGWSWRKTLFGGDAIAGRNDEPRDPATESGRIRAFFVNSDHMRKGIGRQIVELCESEARGFGFKRMELGATVPGERLYRALGYIAAESYEHECEPGKFMTVIPMSKDILEE